jgi:predicted Rdx family selenoprotein
VAAEVKQALGIEAKIIKGDGGVFDVRANGKLIYSKDKTFQFPEDGEITQLLKAE